MDFFKTKVAAVQETMENTEFKFLLGVIKEFVMASYKEDQTRLKARNPLDIKKKTVGYFEPCRDQAGHLVQYVIRNIKESRFTSRFARYRLEDKTTKNYAYLREMLKEFAQFQKDLGWCDGSQIGQFEDRAKIVGLFFDTFSKDFKKEDYTLRINDDRNLGNEEVNLATTKWIVKKVSPFHYEYDKDQELVKRVEGHGGMGGMNIGSVGGFFNGFFGGSRKRKTARRSTKRKSSKRRRRTHRKH